MSLEEADSYEAASIFCQLSAGRLERSGQGGKYKTLQQDASTRQKKNQFLGIVVCRRLIGGDGRVCESFMDQDENNQTHVD